MVCGCVWLLQVDAVKAAGGGAAAGRAAALAQSALAGWVACNELHAATVAATTGAEPMAVSDMD